MTIELTRVPNAEVKTPADRVVSLQVIGSLRQKDYDLFAAQLDSLIRQHGKLRVLVELVDFQGWTAGAAWKEVKLAIKHFDDIERVAIVGENRFERGMTGLAGAFTSAKVRYFDVERREEAESWIREPGESSKRE